VLATRTCARGDRQRYYTENERQRGHDDRSQTHAARFDRRIAQTAPLFMQLLGEFDDQNGVFSRKTDGRQQTHLEVHVVGQPAQAGGHQRADDPQRYHEHHGDRNRPALVQRRQTQEHHQQRQGIQRWRLRAGQPFLVGQTGPGDTDTGRQLLGNRFDFGHRFTGGVTRRRRTEDLHRFHTVVARQFRRTVDPLALGECGERHHGPGTVAHVPLLQVFRAHASASLTLHVHLFHPTAVDEVVDVATTEGDRQGAVDVGNAHAQGAGLRIVDFQVVLRLIVQTVRTHLVEHLALRGHAEELVARFHQFFVTDTGAVLQEHVETGGVTQLQYRWRGEGKHHRVAEAEEVLLGALGQGKHAVARITLVPRLEHDERQTRALPTTGEVEAVHGEHRRHRPRFFIQQIRTHFVDHDLGSFGTGTRWSLYLGEQYALVFFRQECSRNAGEQPDHADHDQQVGQQIRRLALQDVANAALVAAHAAVEVAVEPAEEAFFRRAVLAFRNGLEHGRAERRGEDQRNQHRQGHGRDDSDRELTVDHTGGTAKERHRQQYRRQHQGDTDQSALDLPHGLLGRFLR